MPAETNQPPEPAGAGEPRVAPLELFFDLVFVFAFTQITRSVAHETTWSGLGRGVLLFVVLWWAWGAFAWLTNAVRSGARSPRVVVLVAMAAMLFVAMAVPRAFGETGLAFAVGWLLAMVLHGVLFAVAAENATATRRAIARLAPGNLGCGVLLVGASFTDGTAQTVLWVAAVVVVYATPYVTGVAGFTIYPGHFAERHGLIIIVALGESIVAIGVGAEDLALDWSTLLAGLVAMLLISSLWWAYFDADAAASERALHAAPGAARSRLAQDVYSYLHIPLVLGVVLAALGLEKMIEHTDEPLEPVPAVALGVGIALFFAGLSAIRLRRGASPGVSSLVPVVVAAATPVVAIGIPSLPAVALLAVVVAVVVAVPSAMRRMTPADV